MLRMDAGGLWTERSSFPSKPWDTQQLPLTPKALFNFSDLNTHSPTHPPTHWGLISLLVCLMTSSQWTPTPPFKGWDTDAGQVMWGPASGTIRDKDVAPMASQNEALWRTGRWWKSHWGNYKRVEGGKDFWGFDNDWNKAPGLPLIR